MALSAIEKIQRHTSRIKDGKAKVKPGHPVRMSEAAGVNDAIRQGDLYLIVIDKVPSDVVLIRSRKDIDRQLVPGNTTGAKHCLDSLDGVELYRPTDWSESTLQGPVFRLSKERTVLHPTHGAVTIPAGFLIECRYQREFDQEQKRERRARD
jgi:hypothetical protein